MFQLAQLISFWLVFAVGVGGLIWLICRLYDTAFTYTATLFQLNNEFREFMFTKARNKKGKLQKME